MPPGAPEDGDSAAIRIGAAARDLTTDEGRLPRNGVVTAETMHLDRLPWTEGADSHRRRETHLALADILVSVAENGTNIIATCDDAYFGLFYEEATLKESLFALLCHRHPRLLAVKLDGATKENYVWGLRVGFLTYGGYFLNRAEPAYEALEKKTAGCIRGTISNASHMSQSIVLKSMQDDRFINEKKEKYEILKRRAERVKVVISDPKYQDAFTAYPFNSGYFMCIRLKTVEAEPLRRHLLETYQVGLISLGKTDLRIAFSCLEVNEVSDLFDTILKGIKELENH